MRIHPGIFKAYDIRGLYPGEIDETIAHQIGRGFVAYLSAGRVGVSRDMRVSSPAIAAAFIDGAREQGASVVDYGMLPTDVLYFATVTDRLDGGAQITASHNPKQYNGVKMVRAEALPLSGDAGIGDIRDMIANDRLPAPRASRGSLASREPLPQYVDKVFSFIEPAIIKPFNVVLDAGSGMAGLVAPMLFDRLPCRTTRLCFDVDGTFPNHEANPLIEENRRDITAEVVRQGADIGIAWDGDADRCFFIDGSGEFISGDFVTALLAEAFLLKHPGATVIYDLRASHAVRDTVAAHKGKALMNRVGHAFIKQRMRQEDGIFAGEVTGHYYFRDFYYADNGFIPALLILELMSKKNMPLRDLLRPYRERYFISGEINTTLRSVEDAPKKLAAIEARYRDATLSRMDGLSVDYADWHFNIRASNTEPLLRLNLEAKTPEMMERKRDEVLELIRA
ncbi:MAG TPA: phosphomannomutase/phosphoglucomutase [Vicinamibacterales bacterium]|nr:phosphomannomutase/phosphoglucomutase [Vicinamibacterales bacterium]